MTSKAITITVILMLAFLAACTGQTIAQDTIKIGASMPLTGHTMNYGSSNLMGLQLGIDQINNDGGINGKQIELIVEDTESESIKATIAVQKLININDVSFVFSSASSPETLASAPIAEMNKIPMLALGSTAPKVRFAGDYIFRNKISIDKEIEQLLDYSYNKLGAKNIYVLYAMNDFGEGGKESAIGYFPKINGKILETEGFKVEDADFKTHLFKVKEKDPDVVLIIGWTQNTAQIIKQASELGIDKQFIAPVGAVGPDLFKIAGESAENLIFTSDFDYNSNEIEVLQFKKDFIEKYGREPEIPIFAALGYDGAMIISKVLKICEDDSECIKEELYKIEHKGVTGDIKFDEYGDVINDMKLMIVKDGKFVEYEVWE